MMNVNHYTLVGLVMRDGVFDSLNNNSVRFSIRVSGTGGRDPLFVSFIYHLNGRRYPSFIKQGAYVRVEGRLASSGSSGADGGRCHQLKMPLIADEVFRA